LRDRRFDLNGNGTIEVDELATVFQVLAPRGLAPTGPVATDNKKPWKIGRSTIFGKITS
jgi:Ca2+-binding EF-hand superfamily protein